MNLSVCYLDILLYTCFAIANNAAPAIAPNNVGPIAADCCARPIRSYVVTLAK